MPDIRFDKRDFRIIADWVMDEWKRRKNKRKDLERQCKDIDRQVKMEPDISFKLNADGSPDPLKKWMPEMELPLQAQTLEVLTADARRMLEPDSGPWFAAHAALTDEYLERVDFQSLVAGDQNEIPSKIGQDNADKLVQGTLSHWQRQYDFWGNIDSINVEAFKYGEGIARVRLVTKEIMKETARGIVSEKEQFPVLIPRSFWNTYLDDREFTLMNEGFYIGPTVMFEVVQHIDDLKRAANKGSNDPNKENGGWLPKNLHGLEGDKNGEVRLIEVEGDIVVSRKTVDSIYLPNVIMTIAVGSKEKKDNVGEVVRARFRKYPSSTYLRFPYHAEDMKTPYSTSPLMKGRPIQMSAVEALTRFLMCAALNTEPPIGYDKDDMAFASTGGPRIYPGAQWGTAGEVNVHQFGDPKTMLIAFQEFVRQYYDVTGVNQPRLGAQTLSHTTAFAKNAELNRGVVRTVDYTKSTLRGPLTKYLDMAFTMGKDVMKPSTIFIDSYGGFVDMRKEFLPDLCVFDAHGAGGPQEEMVKMQRRVQSLQMAIQMDQLGLQVGKPPKVDIDAAIESVLRDGGWTDIDVITIGNQPAQRPAGQPGLADYLEQNGTSPGAALQALALAGQQ